VCEEQVVLPRERDSVRERLQVGDRGVGLLGKFSQRIFVRSVTRAAERSGRNPRSAGIRSDTGVPPASRVLTP
jgi:hypothetical protein